MKQISLIARWPLSIIDRINDRLTSYRLMLYFLLTLLGWAVISSFFGNIAYNWHEILVSAAWISAVCWTANKLISRFLDIPANKESDLITALILALILTPPAGTKGFVIVAGAALAAIASKYVISYNRSHILNPAAAGAVVSGVFFHQYASWWVGTAALAPLVLAGGILIMRKMKRFWMVTAFTLVYGLFLHQQFDGARPLHTVWIAASTTAVMFFAFVMLTEPQTSPADAQNYVPYAVIVALGYSITKLKISPEEALLIGNGFTFIFARNRRYQLKFIRKINEASGIYSYLFSMPPRFSFRPGQYMEWTIAHNQTDSRGNRRYLTISSSPTEPGLMFTVKHPPEKLSAFKQKLDELKPGDTILASGLAGSFTLPKNPSKKIALMAGGVGITPFRSMVKYLVDSGQKRDVALLYSANSDAEIAFKQLFSKAQPAGLRAGYITSGHIDEAKIQAALPDFAQRRFYISGPYPFVHAVQTALLKLGVKPTEIVTDYFPGYGG